jgi:hypothetical protein
MPLVNISAEVLFNRTVELLAGDTSRLPPAPPHSMYPAPVPRRRKKVKTYMLTHAEREALEEPQSFVFSPVLLFGPVNRPLFEIDESELPY